MSPDHSRHRPLHWFGHGAGTSLRELRPTKVQVAALILLTVFSLGPVVALVVVLSADPSPVRVLYDAPDAVDDDTAQVTATVVRVSPVQGEVGVRLLLIPPAELLRAGPPLEPLTMLVNDSRGQTEFRFDDGQRPGPVEVTIAMGGGSVSRYPFDQYRSDLALLVSRDRLANGAGQGEAADPDDPFPGTVPLVMDLTTTLTDFDFSVTDPDPDAVLTVLSFDVQRSTATTVYATGIMVLMWGLAISGVLIAWAVVTWRVETPIWVYAYLVGILFALTPLREALPGRPPPGTLVDYVAFYWSVSILGTTLLLLVLLWMRRSRPSSTAPPTTGPPDRGPADAGSRRDPPGRHPHREAEASGTPEAEASGTPEAEPAS